MYKKKKVSVVFPVYNEEKGIKKAIDDFFATGVVDEIVAVDNNSTDKSAELIKSTQAVYVLEKKQGYGNALQTGLKKATGDIIFTCEPDGTFEADDIFKFLPYICECDAVFGTRTSKTLIWDNAKMDGFLRLGNVFVAKMLEYLHNGPCFTDVGCTFKAINKKPLKQIQKSFTVGGSSFQPEFMILCIRNKLKVLEIPVNYKERVGESKITNNFWKSFKLGVEMMGLILKYRI